LKTEWLSERSLMIETKLEIKSVNNICNCITELTVPDLESSWVSALQTDSYTVVAIPFYKLLDSGSFLEDPKVILLEWELNIVK